MRQVDNTHGQWLGFHRQTNESRVVQKMLRERAWCVCNVLRLAVYPPRRLQRDGIAVCMFRWGKTRGLGEAFSGIRTYVRAGGDDGSATLYVYICTRLIWDDWERSGGVMMAGGLEEVENLRCGSTCLSIVEMWRVHVET